jgi:ATP-binding cassette subfamily C protein LapB
VLSGDLNPDLQHNDPLLDCLVELTHVLGRPSTRAALSAGLPLENGCLTPSLFERAAARAGLSTRIMRRALNRLNAVLLPAILLLKDDQACVLLGWRKSKSEGRSRYTARLLFPETGQGEVRLSREDLAARYTGVALFAKPRFLFDARAPEVGKIAGRHWFWKALLEQMPVYRDVLGAALTINVFAVTLPLFTMNVYDRVVPNRDATDTLWMLAIGMFLVFGMDFAMRLLRSHFIDLASARIDVRLSALIMERVLGMRLEGRPASVGSFASNLRSFESVRDFIASTTVTALIDLPFALLFLLVIAWIAWPLALVPLCGLFIGLIYAYILQFKMHDLAETTYRAIALRNASLIESLTALETIKTQGAESVVQGKWERTTAFLARTNAQLRLLSAFASNGATLIMQLVNVVLVIIGVYLIHEHALTLGGLIAATMLGGRAIAPLTQGVGLLMQFQNARSSLSTLEKLMELPVERPNVETSEAFIHRPELKGAIEFRDVSFAYPNQGVMALKHISLRIEPGERVVILGGTGSGKSTLQKLMLGLYQPNKGAVCMDGIDLRQLDPADLRRNVGYVGQESMLFYGTLRENIAIGAPYASDAAIIHAADMAWLTPFVNRHPKGFDMQIGERGESLSGGQRQQVTIARAMLMDPPVLLFDEPTSAMDFSTETAFKDRLRHYAAHRTLVIVTHRTSLIDLASRIIVVDDGRIIADGPRDKVIQALQSGQIRKAPS